MARIGEVLRGEATWGEWWLDQLGHIGLGAIYSSVGTALGLFVFGWGSWTSLGFGAGLALFGGVARELYQGLKTKKPHLDDRALDAVFHLPGVVVPGVYLLVRWLT